jgi:hypothetical protein
MHSKKKRLVLTTEHYEVTVVSYRRVSRPSQCPHCGMSLDEGSADHDWIDPLMVDAKRTVPPERDRTDFISDD